MTNSQNRTAARTAALDAAGPNTNNRGIEVCIAWLMGEESPFGELGTLLLLAAAGIDYEYARKYYTYLTRW